LLRVWNFITEVATVRAVVVRWVVLAGLLAIVGARWLPGPRNLALHKPVTTSSNCGLRPKPSPFPVEGARAVDGKRDRGYDACTRAERDPWMQVDLLRQALVRKVVVYGRNDCCWTRSTLPLVLELSPDGLNYQPAALRTMPFTRETPWVIELPGVSARFVRLKAPGPRQMIVLSEIEVYGD
jgi:hypothetical protein